MTPTLKPVYKMAPHQRRLAAVLEQYRDKEPRPGAEGRHLMRLWREYLYPMRWRLLLAIFFMLIFSMQRFGWAFMVKIVVDVILMVGKEIPPAELEKHYLWIVYLFFANTGYHLFNIGCLWLYHYQITLAGQRVVYHLRKALHEKLQSLPLSFFDRTQTGRLLAVLVDDVQTIEQTVSTAGVNGLVFLAQIVAGATVMCVINWKLSIWVFLALPAYVMVFRHYRPMIRDSAIAARRGTTTLYNRVEERLVGIRTLKVFGREHSETRSFVEAVGDLARLMMYNIRLSNWQNTMAQTISSLATGGVLYFGFQAMRTGAMSLGDVMFFFTVATFLFMPAVQLSTVSVQLQHVSVVMRRIFDLMEAEQEPPDRPGAVDLPKARGDIAFDRVTFTYPTDEHPTLREVSFQVPSGKQVAIMGPSGSGKSTLLYLLMRFYDPDEGSITLDGRDLRDIKLNSLRDRITLVMQEPVIFSGTVAENIRYGHFGASDEEVQRAAKAADLHEFILSLPDSYETVVGERGMSLSGGQRQRLALAASLVSNPNVLLLDDTTSALDPSTEARVQKTLNRMMTDRTCFVVTHRVSTALASDLVLVLEDGRVTQFGPSAELLKQDGLFRRVYEQQRRESADTTAQATAPSLENLPEPELEELSES